MHTTPPSAKTMAPPSRKNSLYRGVSLHTPQCGLPSLCVSPTRLGRRTLTVTGSRCTEAVKPAAEEPFPEVYTDIGETFSTNFNNCDLAVPGSPSSKTLMSPLSLAPSGKSFLEPPMRRQVTAFLMSERYQLTSFISPVVLLSYLSRSVLRLHVKDSPRFPKILGATLAANLSYSPSLLASAWNSSSSSGVNPLLPGLVARLVSNSIPNTLK